MWILNHHGQREPISSQTLLTATWSSSFGVWTASQSRTSLIKSLGSRMSNGTYGNNNKTLHNSGKVLTEVFVHFWSYFGKIWRGCRIICENDTWIDIMCKIKIIIFCSKIFDVSGNSLSIVCFTYCTSSGRLVLLCEECYICCNWAAVCVIEKRYCAL